MKRGGVVPKSIKCFLLICSNLRSIGFCRTIFLRSCVKYSILPHFFMLSHEIKSMLWYIQLVFSFFLMLYLEVFVIVLSLSFISLKYSIASSADVIILSSGDDDDDECGGCPFLSLK